MKNAMKKLMSLLLVAVLLVSAVPFQADAATGDVGFVITLQNGEGTTILGPREWVEANAQGPKTKTPRDMLTFMDAEWEEKYVFVSASAKLSDGNYNGYGIDDTIHSEVSREIFIKLDARPVYTVNVHYKTQDGTAIGSPVPFSILDGNTLSFNAVSEARPQKDAYTLKRFLVGQTVYESGAWEPTSSTDIVATLVPKGGTTPDDTTPPTTTPDTTTPTTGTITLKVDVDSQLITKTKTVNSGVGAKVNDLMKELWNANWETTYSDYNCAVSGGLTLNSVVYGGTSVTVTLTRKPTTSTPTTPDNSDDNIFVGSNGGYDVNKDPYKIKLNIYRDGNISTVSKVIDITNGIAKDGYVDMPEVRTLLLKYYNAKTAEGLDVDGLYIAFGNWGGKYTTDSGRYDVLTNLNEERKAHEVNINIMLKNATPINNNYSSSDNPKTGDEIFMTVTVLGLSASALAVLFFFVNKKKHVA